MLGYLQVPNPDWKRKRGGGRAPQLGWESGLSGGGLLWRLHGERRGGSSHRPAEQKGPAGKASLSCIPAGRGKGHPGGVTPVTSAQPEWGQRARKPGSKRQVWVVLGSGERPVRDGNQGKGGKEPGRGACSDHETSINPEDGAAEKGAGQQLRAGRRTQGGRAEGVATRGASGQL